MGKSLLIILAGAAVIGAIAMGSLRTTSSAVDQKNSQYEGEVMAREVARTGLNLALAQAQRDFLNADQQINTKFGTAKSYQGGTYKAMASRVSASIMDITVSGKYGDLNHTIKAKLVRQAPLDAAVMVEAPVIDATFDGEDFRISGNDTPKPSVKYAFDKHGIKSNVRAVRDSLRHNLGASRISQVVGLEGSGDIVDGNSDLSLQDLYTEAKAKADIKWTSSVVTGNGLPIGSTSSPAIVLATGGVTIKGTTTGYGILVVDGNLTITEGVFRWEGIVIAKKESDLSVTLNADAQIRGSLVLLQGSSAFNMPVEGKLKVKYLSSSAGLESAVYIHPYNHDPELLFNKGSNRTGDQMSKSSWETVYQAGQQMNFFIRVYKAGSSTPLYDHYGRGHDAPSGKPYALVEQVDTYKWRISFEDLDEDPTLQKKAGYGKPDWDYNDQIIEVEIDCKDTASKCETNSGGGQEEEFQEWWTMGGSGSHSGGGSGSGGSVTGSQLHFNVGGATRITYSSQVINTLISRLDLLRENGRVMVADKWEN